MLDGRMWNGRGRRRGAGALGLRALGLRALALLAPGLMLAVVVGAGLTVWAADLREVRLLSPDGGDPGPTGIYRDGAGEMVFHDTLTSAVTLSQLAAGGAGGGGAVAAGPEGAVQFNVSGAAGGDAELIWRNQEKRLVVQSVKVGALGGLVVDAFNSWNSPAGLVASVVRSAGPVRAAWFSPASDSQDLRLEVSAGRRTVFRSAGETVAAIDSGGTVTAAAFVGSGRGLTDLPAMGLLVEGAGGEACMDRPRLLDMAMRRIGNVAWPLEADDAATRRFVEDRPRLLDLWRDTPALAHWTFNDTEGPFRDVIAGAHLTAVTTDWDRSVYTTAGLVGLAADFGAGGGAMKLAWRDGRAPRLDGYPFSVSVWVRSDGPFDGTYRNVFSLNNGFYDVTQGLGVRNGRACLRDSQSAFYEATTPTVTDGTWRHLVAVFESSQTGGKRLYVDGVLRFQSAQATQPFVDDQFAGDANDYNRINVGAYWRNDLYGPTNHFSGAVDDLRVFGKALDGAEIATLYNGGLGTEEPLYAPERIGADTALIDADQDTWVRLDTGPEGDRIRMAVGDTEIVRIADPPDGDPWLRLNGALALGDMPTPSGRLHIIGGAGGLGDHGLVIDGYGNSAAVGGRIELRHSRGLDVGAPSATWDGESLGFLHFCGVNSADHFDLGARVQAIQSGAAGAHVPARLEMIAASATDALAAALVVDGPGQRVDIQGALTVDAEVTSPGARLLVGGDAQIHGMVYGDGFAVLSARSAKVDIAPAFDVGEANPVRDLMARRYRLRDEGGNAGGRERLGFVAEEAPPRFRVTLPDGRPGVDLMAVVAALVEDNRRLGDRVAALEQSANRAPGSKIGGSSHEAQCGSGGAP